MVFNKYGAEGADGVGEELVKGDGCIVPSFQSTEGRAGVGEPEDVGFGQIQIFGGGKGLGRFPGVADDMNKIWVYFMFLQDLEPDFCY